MHRQPHLLDPISALNKVICVLRVLYNIWLLFLPQWSVYVGSPSGVVQLPLSSCGRYTSCYDCIFARDPHCAWNGAECVDVMMQADRSVWKVVCVWLDQVIKVPFCTFDLSEVKVSACPVTLSHCCVIQCWQTADGCDCKHSLCTLGVLIIQERYASSLESRYRSNK